VRVRIEYGIGQLVRHGVVHGDEHLPRLHRERDNGFGRQAAALRGDYDPIARLDAELGGVAGIYFGINVG